MQYNTLFGLRKTTKQYIVGGWTCPKCGCEIDWLGKKVVKSLQHKESQRVASQPSATIRASKLRLPKFSLDRNKKVIVHLSETTKSIQVDTEIVRVPRGVVIKVKRSRTIEHSVEINWKAVGEIKIDAGIKELLNGSIRGEIERQQGRSRKLSETMEYEVELNGNQSSQYRLKWMDLWREGYVELHQSKNIDTIPFTYKERAELDVEEV